MLVDGHMVEERLSAWQKKKVRTIVVNSRSKVASRRSIAGAISIAKPYDRIELVGGEYFETLSITFPLEIVAAEGEDPSIVSRGTCVTITQDVEAYFEHVEFISKGKGRTEAAVALMHGRAVFFRCKLSSVIVGGFARPHMEHCTIAESYNGYGVQISDNSNVDIQHCTVHTHHIACVDIDTKGVVMLQESTLRQPANGGNVVSVRASQSFMDETTPVENLACRKVTVTKCHIYVTSEYYKPKDREWIGDTATGSPSCVLISRGACPVFTFNELLEGFIGFTFEFAGSAVLEGNVICNQKQCGILAIVDEKSYSADTKEQNLRITGGNLIDRCHIGIDVHCAGKPVLPIGSEQGSILSQNLPSCGNAFSWLERLRRTCDKRSISVRDHEGNIPVRVNSHTMALERLKEELRLLARLVCAGHPSHFSGSDSQQGRHGGSGVNFLGETLRETLNISVPSPNTAEAAAQMLKLRGNRGIDILDTRFSSCGLCAVRFENDGYGLVEDCDFVNCGATAIVVGSGAHPLIVGCKFDQSKGAGIFVDNFANPLIMGNEISNNAEHGIEFRNLSCGIVMGNLIIGNTLSGVYVSSGSTTIVAGNCIQQCHSTGVTVSSGSRPVLVMNKFVSNLATQVLVSEYCTPVIACNNFLASTGAGLRFESCSGGTVIDNTIASNERGIVVELDADPYVVSNKITNCSRHGVVVGNNGLGTFVSNEITQSGSCNFVVQEGGSPVVRNNIIKQGHSGGVAVLAEGFGTIEHNLITENAVGNVIVLDRFTEPVFVSNTISSSFSGAGVICGREACGNFMRNSIYQNKQCGVYVIGKANPTMVNNTITSETIGIIVSSHGRGIFKENNIHTCHSSGIIIQLNGEPVIQGNTISKCFLSGLLVAPESSGSVIGNTFHENDVGVQLGSTLGTTELDLEINLVSGTPSPISASEKIGPLKPRRSLAAKKGVEFQTGSKSNPTEVRQNKICANATCGVLLESGACGVLEDNDIESNEMYGVMADVGYSAKRAQEKLGKKLGQGGWKLPQVTAGGGSAIIRSNRIFHHKHSNIAILDHAFNGITIASNDVYESPSGVYVRNNATIHSIFGNTIRDCFDGVYAESGGRGCFENNKIQDCSGVGVYVFDRADPLFKSGNVIERCQAGGVFVDVGGRGVFSQTTVTNCVVGVVVYTCQPISSVVQEEDYVKSGFLTSAPTFEQCVIEKNSLHGVLVLTVPSGCPLRRHTNDALKHYQKVEGLVNAPGVAMFPQFRQNTIRNNRHIGVCHETYYAGEFAEGQDGATPCTSPSKSKRATHSHMHPHRRTSGVHLSRSTHRYSLQEALGTSTMFNADDHHQERMRRQVSFVDNIITNCSIGVVVGGGCHPFLLRNRIHSNAFFGMLLRLNAKAMCCGCELTDNGIAGLYAAQGAIGVFAYGVIRRNNSFCRPNGSPNDPRSFHTLPFVQPVAQVESSSFVFDDFLHTAYVDVMNLHECYANIVADGLCLLCEVVAASSNGLSLAAATFPGVQYDAVRASSNGLLLEDYDRGWAADGGIGAWMVQGSMTEVTGNLVEGNRNIGVFYSRGIEHHHQNVTHFPVYPAGGFPTIPGGEVISGRERSTQDQSGRCLLFSSNAVNPRCGDTERLSPSSLPSGRGHNGSHDPHTPPGTPRDGEAYSALADAPLLLRRPGAVRGNRITKNGYGLVMHLHHVTKAHAFNDGNASDSTSARAQELGTGGSKGNAGRKPAARRKGSKVLVTSLREGKLRRGSSAAKTRKENERAGDSSHNSAAPAAVTSVTATSTATIAPTTKVAGAASLMLSNTDLGEPEFAVTVEENHVFENCKMGVLCQHVVEAMCGRLLTSRLAFEDVAKEYDDVCVQITLKGELKQPKPRFELVPFGQMTRHARLSGNEIYNNASTQMEVTSRYVAIALDKTRTLLQLDTLRHPNASMCSSQALIRIPLFASLIMTTPPGMFLIESNRFRDGARGIHLVGLLGSNSCCLRHNAFVSIAGTAVHLEGHLASASIGNGNVFEMNDVAVRIVLPDGNISEEDRKQQEAMGVVTRIYGNLFSAPRSISVTVEGGGALPPVISGNNFSNHMCGSVAFFIDGSTVSARLTKNVFTENYIPVIISNRAGTGEGAGGAVVAEENRFSRNYIGLLVCGGAAPRLLRNVFEQNYRAGLEIVGDETKPLVRHCVFAMHKQWEQEASTKVVFAYPKDGQLCLQGVPKFEATLVPDNSASPNGKGHLPAGVLLSADGNGLVDQCLFKENAIGLDVVRSAAPITVQPCSSCFRLTSCFFTENVVSGVWVRGGVVSNSKVAARAVLSDTLADVGSPAIEGCFFAHNVNDTENLGDVVALDGGFAAFRGNMFTGCVHGKKDGMALFENNTLLFSGAIDVAVRMHKATRIRLVGNTIRGYKTGVVTEPGAWGQLEKNWILNSTRSVIAAPFCHTLFTGNRIMKAKDCGVVTYGGVFTDNEICSCPTGVVVQNPIEYKNYDLIPAIERTAFDALLSENRVHSCEVDGILVAGGARIEGNIVFNCKNNMNVICPQRVGNVTSIATISRNVLYDGDVGILVAKGSDSVIRDNDIFDNAFVGVWVRAGASGALQGNAISSSLRDGALELEQGCEMKVMQNTVRNQFSPSYHRTLPMHREKERQRAAEALVLELQELDTAVAELGGRCNQVEMTLRAILESLKQEGGAGDGLSSLGGTVMVGAASKALRASALAVNTADSLTVPGGKGLRRGSVDKSVSISAVRASRSVDRRMSQSTIPTTHDKYQHVLIHVFSAGKATLEGTQLGKKVEAAFASSPVASRVKFHTTLTTNSSSLAASLTAQRPDVVVIVVGAGKSEFDAEETIALSSLDRLRRGSVGGERRRSSESGVMCAFTLLPPGWKAKVERRSSSKKEGAARISMEQYAAAHNPIYYHDNVSDAILEMERRLESQFPASPLGFQSARDGEEEIGRATTAPPNKVQVLQQSLGQKNSLSLHISAAISLPSSPSEAFKMSKWKSPEERQSGPGPLLVSPNTNTKVLSVDLPKVKTAQDPITR
ncbi:hypothetical protein DQ04_00911080 [Trypanosoma grayi]|uniref:hypothetical protein n=1 Tax=Trypanosoma grayi TaxID=71804 RepID=UPI0004F40477|nr:hypothetical protein DQ04_00911080 [Trypanosoma grayi]KEG13596.1 hypothetical protein DQ04_00911080 [Trypanosoma grayi]